MSRSFERKFIYAACIWQLVTGALTVFFYPIYIRAHSGNLENLSFAQQKGIESYFSSLYSFTVTYGVFFMVVAVINFLLTRKLVKDGTLQYKFPLYLICLSGVCYFLNDYLSLALCLAAAVIALAKNKPLKTISSNN
ncbi:hypothetical protein LRR81_14185 [Metabacillus sp. GX 13764]|uniref:hypothetical protein n=1 Tax=Metabacillus kandeliae TaxID=2900151 RepID=UPI001E36845C|nr:hypothetical protein [Metabacillus kandeliae]MCD7035390.1 hypothetical protein [Metabacillus kandeliae]